MKKSIRFNTEKGITGEIRFDSESVDFIEYNATVVFDGWKRDCYRKCI